MNKDMINLSLFFFEHVKGMERDGAGQIETPPAYKKTIMTSISGLLQKGFSASQLYEVMKRYVSEVAEYPLVYKPDDIVAHFGITPEGKKPKEFVKDDLMTAGKFYYHPALQIVPPPPTLKINDDGTFESSVEKDSFYLEMKNHFTMDDLLNYFYNRANIVETKHPERDKGSFKFLLRHLSLDHILYTIDEACALVEDGEGRPLSNPLDLQQYILNGKNLLEDRMNACFEEGVNYVKPRFE